ncbi:MAG: mannose-1-phosphate guanylyltransferase [Cyanothece sp. SIO1E1]|nr:mannose-1-phosphate guanylyltransferase [Cyanothece sp. SIO1E1]
MDRPLIPVILAGGKGERFWPLSRKQRPKQFLCLDGSGSCLLQSTAERLLPLAGGWDALWVITAAHLADGVRELLPQLPEANLLIEPEGRDTAAAVAWATLELARRYGEEAIAGFFPADHWIADEAKFQQTLRAAADLAVSQKAIATLGVMPTYPSTGYGYIEQGEAVGTYDDLPAYRVSRFTEKPDQSTAEMFLSSGSFSWNSGMFIFQTGVMLDELRTYAPTILEPIAERGVDCYPELPKKSIDYALMEQTQKAYVLPVSFGWDDLGDWNAVERLLKNGQPNIELANHVGLDTNASIFYASNEEEVIVTIGLEDVVVVRDGNATLVVHKEKTQEIKKALTLLKENPKFQDLL